MIVSSRNRWLPLIGVCAAIAAADALAQSYPSRPVRMVISASAGGAADTPGRIVGAKLAEALGQQVLFDNRPGAGGVVGTDFVAKSPADGYTVLMVGNTYAIRANIYKKLPYDPVNDFAPVLQFMTSPNVLVVHPSLPVKSVQELIAFAKAKPGQLDFVSSGNGSSQHLFTALFISMTGIRMNHVPYKGSGQARADLLGGHVPVGVPGIASVIHDIKSGRLRVLAVTGANRSPQLPDVPTMAEAGVKGYAAEQWFGLLAPAGTPKEAITRLNVEMPKILKQPDLQRQLRNLGAETDYLGPEAFNALIKSELVKWAKIIELVGARVE